MSEERCGGTGMVAYWDGSAYAGEMCRGCVDCEGPDDDDGCDDQCEKELTSHGYTPCRCHERRAQFPSADAGRDPMSTPDELAVEVEKDIELIDSFLGNCEWNDSWSEDRACDAREALRRIGEAADALRRPSPEAAPGVDYRSLAADCEELMLSLQSATNVFRQLAALPAAPGSTPTQALSSVTDSERRALDNIPEFFGDEPMKKAPRYSIGGYEGDQLQPIVRAILNDADAHPLRRVPLRELVDELQKHLTAFDQAGAPPTHKE